MHSYLWDLRITSTDLYKSFRIKVKKEKEKKMCVSGGGGGGERKGGKG